MIPFIPKHYYSDDAIHAREQAVLFRGQWQFVGFEAELANENDFLTRDVGGKSIFLQNVGGTLLAAENVCSHRFSRIHQGCGNRPLQCPYHGWKYDAQGYPSAIPRRPRFDDLNPEKCQSLRLSVWNVERCGKLIFVREGLDHDDGISLREFMGEIFEPMQAMTLAFGPQIDRNEMLINANWKILIENTLEGYHVDFVHSESFKRLGTGVGDWTWHLPHSAYASPLSEQFDADCQRVLSLFADRPMQIDGYFHQLVFPNLTLATTYGTSFSVQHFEPVGPNQTKFVSYVFQSKLEKQLSRLEEILLETINHSVVQFNRQVFEEDRGVCEWVHQGAQQSSQTGLLSDEEYRVAEFQKSYMTALDSAVKNPLRLEIHKAA